MNIIKEFPWKKLVRVGKPFWISETRDVAYKRFFTLLALIAGQTFVLLLINKTNGAFFTAIEKHAMWDYYLFMAIYIALLGINTPLQVKISLSRTRLALLWRSWLSKTIFASACSENNLGKFIDRPDIDHPEQRMTQDLDSFCNSLLGLVISIIEASAHVVIFSVVLYKLSPALFWTDLVYSTVGVLIVASIGKDMPALNNKQFASEAALRTTLAQTNDANYLATGASASLHREALEHLDTVIKTLLGIANLNCRVQMFTTGFNLLVPLIPAIIMAPLYFDGKVEFGVITQSVMAFTVVFNGATLLIAQFGGISAFAAVTNRVGSLLEELGSAKQTGKTSVLAADNSCAYAVKEAVCENRG
jgi:putative ATP-binding cassette transporter